MIYVASFASVHQLGKSGELTLGHQGAGRRELDRKKNNRGKKCTLAWIVTTREPREIITTTEVNMLSD